MLIIKIIIGRPPTVKPLQPYRAKSYKKQKTIKYSALDKHTTPTSNLGSAPGSSRTVCSTEPPLSVSTYHALPKATSDSLKELYRANLVQLNEERGGFYLQKGAPERFARPGLPWGTGPHRGMTCAADCILELSFRLR
jgi:hypothetical protein